MKFLKLLGLLLLTLLLFMLWMNWPVKLDSSQTQAATLPSSNASVKVTVLKTGHMLSTHALSVRGGRWEPYHSVMNAVLIEHPKGRYLIDTAWGKNVQAHFKTTPLLMQKTAELHATSSTLAELNKLGLAASDLNGVLLTHAHWDHVSGLEDMLSVPVLLAAEEKAFIDTGHDNTVLVGQWLEQIQFIEKDFVPAQAGDLAPFLDLFGDGSVVLYKMPGHTPGSVSVLVNTDQNQQLLFIGDTSWTAEGVQWPAEKPWLAKVMADSVPAEVAEWLKQLHQLQKRYPDLVIVPAHAEMGYDKIR